MSHLRPLAAKATLAATVAAGLLALGLQAGTAWSSPVGAEAREDGWITGKEALAEIVADRTHYRDRSDGSSEIEYHTTDGRSAYLWDSCIERGQWWTTEQQVCFFYPDTALQGPHCFWVRRNDQEQLEFWWAGDPGALLPTATTVEDAAGNVERLPLDTTGECVMS